METQEISFSLGDPGTSQALIVSSTSAQSAVALTTSVVATPTVDCFVRQGANPTALADGTDMFLLALTSYRLALPRGNKLAFVTSSATGTAYLTPGA